MRRRQESAVLIQCISTVIGAGTGLTRFLPSLFRSRSALIAENLSLRKQLGFYREREIEPRRLTDAARRCLVVWLRLCNWRETLVIVKPDTLIGWHRKAFRLFWKWKSKGGRPRLPMNVRQLIAEMAAENPTWGEERILVAIEAVDGRQRPGKTDLWQCPSNGPLGRRNPRTFFAKHSAGKDVAG